MSAAASCVSQSHDGLDDLVQLISQANPLQSRRIRNFVEAQDESYWAFAERLTAQLRRSYLGTAEGRRAAAAAYNRMCMDYVREQISFRKTGKYPLLAAEANDQVYSRPEVMRYYMIGLLLTYLFWPNQYSILRFFRTCLTTMRLRNYLEVGVGHGLFAAEALRHGVRDSTTLVDLSATSIEIAREMLSTFEVDPRQADFVQGDFLRVELPQAHYDFVVLGEILEHVDHPEAFLRQAGSALSPDGQMFVSTCANCPAIDHVYHFHNVAEIRAMLRQSGFSIHSEFAQASENLPPEEWEEALVPVNYCAIVRRG